MSRTVEYVDRQGNVYSEIPTGKVQPYLVKGQAVTEDAHDRYYDAHPTELDEVVITPETYQEPTSYDPTMTEQNMFHRAKVAAADAQVRRTAFTDDNTLQFWLDALSPTQHLRAIYDGVRGGSYQDYVNSLKYGNNGPFTNAYAARNPGITKAGNFGIDLVAPYSWMRFFKYATTPRMIGQGASKQAWRMSPFSSKITYIGGDPAYMAEQSALPKTLKYTYEGVTKDGQAVHTAPRVIMRKRPSKSFVQDMHRRGIFRMRMPGDPEKVWYDRLTKRLFPDAEYGWSPFQGQVLVDPEPMTVPEYLAMMGIQ